MKLPTSCCMPERYELTLLTCATCAGENAPGLTAAGVVSLSRLNSDFTPAAMASAGDCGAACAAAGARAGGAPSFARGAGTGNGTVCANIIGANPPTPTSTTPTSSLRRSLGRMRTPLRFPDRVNRPMWRDDDCKPPGYPDCGEFSIVLRLFFADKDFTLSCVIGLPDDPLFLHSFHERGSAVIPDLQAALDVAGRSLAIAHDDGHGLLIEVGALALTHSGRIENGLTVLILVLGRRH